MGVFTRRRKSDQVQAAADPSTFPIASPWSTSSNLQRMVFEDIFGSDQPVNTRASAMRLGPVSRGRNLFAAAIIQLHLEQLTGDTRSADQPAWLNSSSDGTSPQLRNVATFDDHLFYGWSLWWRVNGPDGFPTDVGRVPIEDWRINDDNKVEIDGEVQPDNRVILIPGIHEGILTFGCDALEDARLLNRAVRQRVQNPVQGIDLHQTSGEPLPKEKRDELIEGFAAARQGKNGGVGYSSPNIELREYGKDVDSALAIEARNASAVELARHVGIHAGMVDATAPKASLNYETATGRNQEFVDYDLMGYLVPIQARLSMDDICPPGERIAFDLSQYTAPAPSPTGPNFED